MVTKEEMKKYCNNCNHSRVGCYYSKECPIPFTFNNESDKMKNTNSLVGKKICGFCNGFFGRDDYEDKIIILEGKKWIVCTYLDEDNESVTCVNFDSEEEKFEYVNQWLKENDSFN